MPKDTPWTSLRYIKEVRLVPASNDATIVVEYTDDWAQEAFTMSNLSSVKKISGHKEYTLRYGTDWTTHFHYDYPDDFKKLARHYGSYDTAYDAYMALQKPVKDDWNKNMEES